MTYDEGLRSYKAIAFIESLTRFYYCKLGTIPKPNVTANQKTFRQLSKLLGEKLWIK
ncbi:MAG: hypothetical protein GX799_04375 [Crenarchaeota archaeon]|nr:hypothetical protein [Thermoproteota archaeon]